FHDAVQWVIDIARISALKYSLIGSLTSRNTGSQDQPLPLTVLDKSERSPVPRMMLLGKHAPDRLPQHVCCILHGAGPPRYYPYVSVVNDTAPVYLKPEGRETLRDFSWLESA